MHKHRLNKQHGFSLIELLVVVAIIGILASVGLVAYQTYIDTSRDEVAISDFRSLNDMIDVDKMAIENSLSSVSSKSENILNTSRCETWRDKVISELNAEKESSFGNTFAVDGNNCGAADNQSGCGTDGTRTYKRGQIMLYCADECATIQQSSFKIRGCLCVGEEECNSVISMNAGDCTTPPDGRIC